MKKLITALLLLMAFLMANDASATRKFWWRNALLGNTSDSMDGISHTQLTDGDVCIVATLSGTTSTFYVYVYDSDGTNSDDPAGCTTQCTRIEADSGTGAWNLANFYTAKMIGTAADGYKYVNVGNSGAFAGSPSTGDCYYRQDTDKWCCYDGNWKCVTLTNP